MLATSDTFGEAVAQSHKLASKVTIGDLELPIREGTVTLDSKAAVRGSVSLTLALDNADLDLYVPDDPTALLAPYGNEMVVSRGVTYPDDTQELIQMGVFRIDETTIDDDGDSLSLSVTGYDRSAIQVETVLENAGQIAAGTQCGQAIKAKIEDSGYPVTYGDWDDLGPTGAPVTLPLLGYEAGDDRWDLCQAIAEACNRALYFDATGKLVLVPIKVNEQPSLIIAEGTPDLANYTGSEGGLLPSNFLLPGADVFPSDQIGVNVGEQATYEGLYPSATTYPGDNYPGHLEAAIIDADSASLGVLLSISKRWGREAACNRVVVSGQNSQDAPVFGEATDNDPLSPTYYGDGEPFGKVTFNWSSDMVTTETQADYVAQQILDQRRGTAQQIGFAMLPHPGLEPLDTVLLVRARAKVNELHTIDSLSVPLGLGSMSCETRALRVS